MKDPILSVIVPVYNVENYLNRCVDSILTQTFSDFEVILVNDGSKDNSGTLCDQYAREDPRVRVLHKANGGLSDARNAGIDAARGGYLCFIDSDDYIEPEMLEELYRLAKSHEADVSVCGICDCYESGRYPQSDSDREYVLSGVEALQYTLAGRELPGSVCTKLIRRELCEHHRFLKGRTYEDAFYTPELLLQARKVAATTKSLYNYWHREDSITTRPFSEKNMDVVDAYDYTLQVVRERCPELTAVAEFRLLWANFVVLDKMLATNGYEKLPQYGPVVAYLKKNWRKIVGNPHFQKTRRLAAVVLRVSTRLYRLLALRHNHSRGVHS